MDLDNVDYIFDDDVPCPEEEEEDCPTIYLTKDEKARLRETL